MTSALHLSKSNRLRMGSVLVAVAALIGLIAAGPIPLARADGASLDQITGFGSTDSAVTVSWAAGLTGTNNKTIVSPRKQSGSKTFYDDLRNSYDKLKLTVNQTSNLNHQDIQVSWTGGKDSGVDFRGNFLQIMQCYGDEEGGPDPSACQWASLDTVPTYASAVGYSEDLRTTSLCGPSGQVDCDPEEPSSAEHIYPPDPHDATVPFVPVDTKDKYYLKNSVDTPGYPAVRGYDAFFTKYTTNEVPVALTAPDGTGHTTFEAQSGREAAGLGCGDPDPSRGGAPRGCWLVAVPRGEFSPNGYPQTNFGVTTSALSASNWAQRLQVHLDFQPTSVVCSRGADERPTVGTALIATAMTSWQPSLCTAPGGATYGFSETSDPTNEVQLNSAGPGSAGLAFTVSPIPKTNGPPLIYAPVAVTGVGIGFNVDSVSTDPDTGEAVTAQADRMMLTPQLVAKSLTQSYFWDLPGGSSLDHTPSWMPDFARTHPRMIDDPQFTDLNPDLHASYVTYGAPLTTEDQSSLNSDVWAWIDSDSATRAFLRGESDANGFIVNPNYQKLNLGDLPPSLSFPRADPSCFSPPHYPDICVDSVGTIPYVNNYEDAAVRVARASPGGLGGAPSPDCVNGLGVPPYFCKVDPQVVGQRFISGIMGTANAAQYGLNMAGLCSLRCTRPTVQSLSAALKTARPDGSGLLHVEPGNPGVGGYPLTQVVYAAVRIDQSADALRDYATLLDYAAGPGQQPGTASGDLPAGYLPLTPELRSQTRAAAALLRENAAAHPDRVSPPVSNGGSGPAAPQAAAGQNGGSGVASAAPQAPSTSASAAPAADATPSRVAPTPAGAQISGGTNPALAGQMTRKDPLGAIRWVLLAVLIVGAAAAVGGPILRHPPAFLTSGRRRQ